MMEMRVYLASRSPRRRELLAQVGVRFDTILLRSGSRVDAVDETPNPGESAEDYVQRVTLAKLEQGREIVELRQLLQRPILAADTTLELEGDIIGKPVDDADAAAILKRLSGRTHRVLTGVAVYADGRTEYALSTSEVRFRKLDDREIRHYVMSGEPLDKAGAYGIQGRASLFVEYLSGSYSGVMGLPLCETGELLRRFGYQVI
jgi:septum formation protein